MIITLPYDYVAPDEESGALPRVNVGTTQDTWVDLMIYWNSLGYFATPSTGNTIDLNYPPTAFLQERNSYMPVPWWESLCDVDAALFGEVRGWQAIWQVHPTVYDQGFVPALIPNSQYTDDQGTHSRLWKQWGSPNHSHYYLPPGVQEEGLTPDRYFIPTWSWGSNILGTEMMYGQKESGVNIVSRQLFNQALNAGQLQVIPVTPIA